MTVLYVGGEILLRFLSFFFLLVVKFDGSLRPTSTDGTARTASAAAALFVPASSNDKSAVLWLGVKHLDAVQTSGEAEFEGLMVALQGILWLHQRGTLTFPRTEHANHNNSIIFQVQGDCKTVIQQMQGRSRSRKLEPWRERANQLVAQIPFQVQFDHLPRQENMLCDALCDGLLTSRQNFVVQRISERLMELLVVDRTALNDSAAEAMSSSSLRDIQDEFLRAGKTILPGPCRLALYSILARMGWYHGEFDACFQSSRHLQGLADRILKSRRPGLAREAILPFQLIGVQYEMATLRAMNRQKEAQKVERRAKTLLLRQGGTRLAKDDDAASCQSPPCVGNDSSSSSAFYKRLKSEIVEWTQESLADCMSSFDREVFVQDNNNNMATSTDEHLLREAALELYKKSLASPNACCWEIVSSSS